MGSYNLPVGKTAPILDQDGNQIQDGATTGDIADPTIGAFVDVPGGIGFQALSVGTTAVTLTPVGGVGVEHDVTVDAGPFDWSLGTPA